MEDGKEIVSARCAVEDLGSLCVQSGDMKEYAAHRSVADRDSGESSSASESHESRSDSILEGDHMEVANSLAEDFECSPYS